MAKKYALIIGIDAYQDSSFTPLKKAKADADGIEALLKSGALGEFASVQKLVDENNITVGSGVKNFFRNPELEKDDLLLFYFAGHGHRDSDDGKLYFAMADSIKSSLETSALDCAYLKNLMEKSASEKQLIILDSCFSGGFGDARRGVDDFELHKQDLVNQKGRYVISASDKFEYSYEQLGSDNAFKNSIFTHALIDGIQSGEAANTTGALTAESIFKYVREKVKRATNAKQIPKRFIYQGDDDLVLVVSSHQSIPNDLLQELNSTNHDECLVALIKLKHDHLHDENYHKAAGSVLEDKLNHRDYYIRSEANELYLRIKNHKQNGQPKTLASKESKNQSNRSHQKKNNKVQAPELILSKLQPGEVFQDKLKSGGLGPKMVVIPGGEFLMGTVKNASLKNKVKLESFALGETMVTINDYELYCGKVGKRFPKDNNRNGGNRPVIHVSWKDSIEYMQWLSDQSGKIYRLPNEVQWEYACRTGSTKAFSRSYFLNPKQVNSINVKNVPVKSCPPNKFGLHDMEGNVWEWCEQFSANGSKVVLKGEYTMANNISDQSMAIVVGGNNLKKHPYAWRDTRYIRFSYRDVGLRALRVLE